MTPFAELELDLFEFGERCHEFAGRYCAIRQKVSICTIALLPNKENPCDYTKRGVNYALNALR